MKPFITPLERLSLSLGSSLVLFANPARADLVALLGDVMNAPLSPKFPSKALPRLIDRMSTTSEGRHMLKTLSPSRFPADGRIALEKFRLLPDGTLGREYARFMDKRGFQPDERPGTLAFAGDDRERWVLQRYRDVHDIWHVLTKMPTSYVGEVGQKWFEAVHTGLPSAFCMGAGGYLRLGWRDRLTVAHSVIPWAIQCGREAQNLMAIQYEDYMDVQVEELRRRWRITVADIELKGRKAMF